MRSISMAVRSGLIAALAALGLAIGVVAEQERAATTALQSAAIQAGDADPSTAPGKLRIALALLLITFAALGYLLYVLARTKLNAGETQAHETQAHEARSLLGEAKATIIDTPKIDSTASVLPSIEAGQLMSVGALIRRLVHELNNALGPVQGFAELLNNDERLSEHHRRQAARIGGATAAAIRSIQDFAAALGWTNERGAIVHLGEVVKTAASAAQSALGLRIPVAVLPGGDVQITATESAAGQSILHLCAAMAPLLGEREIRIEIQVDSVVGAASSNIDDGAGTGRRLEIWSDPFDLERSRVQFGALQGSWRYGRVRFSCAGHGWTRDLVGRLFNADLSEEHDPSCQSMTVLGGLMLDLGGVIMIDTCPHRQMLVTLLWPARIASEVAAPLEIDTTEDDLDALIIHEAEPAAESLSRRLGSFGLRVASTTSPEAALDLIAEMGPRCRTILIGETSDTALRSRVSAIRPDALLIFLRSDPDAPVGDQETWHIDPDRENLGRLAARLRRGSPPDAAQ